LFPSPFASTTGLGEKVTEKCVQPPAAASVLKATVCPGHEKCEMTTSHTLGFHHAKWWLNSVPMLKASGEDVENPHF